MSWLSQAAKEIKKGIGDVGREIGRATKKLGPVAAVIPGVNVIAGVGKVASALSPSRPRSSGQTAMQLPSTAFPTLGGQPSTQQLLPALAGPIGRVASSIGGGVLGGIGGEIINRLGGTTPSGTNGCGCRSKGRDACTGQVIGGGAAPNATLFGGCCPPGRTLRRISLGRDICIKTPRMNPFNPRALARADRRVTAFARRAAPILKDMGFTVSSTRKVKIKTTRKRSR